MRIKYLEATSFVSLRLAQYATSTLPIMHLVCPQNFAYKALFSISLGTAVIPRRNEKQRLCKIWGGQIRCIMGNVEVAYTP